MCVHVCVASCSSPGSLGGPYHEITKLQPFCIFFWVTCFGCAAPCCHKFVNITSFNDAMMSCMMSLCCTCVGHVTNYYKRPQMPWLGFRWFSQLGLVHLRLSSGWYLTCVGHNTSSTSPSGSLHPSTIIIVFAWVNSAVSTAGDL